MTDTDAPPRAQAVVEAKHREIARRYAWQQTQRLERSGKKLDKNRRWKLIRLRELERVFQHRYGRQLPDDDAGLDDLALAMQHVAYLGDDVVNNCVAWARMWAPWADEADVRATARDVIMARPVMLKARAVGHLLRLSAADRKLLAITTIAPFDMTKAEREDKQKREHAERQRKRRARLSTGRPRGRPKAAYAATDAERAHKYRENKKAQLARNPLPDRHEKCVRTSKDYIAAHGISVTVGVTGLSSAHL
jgi:hypothetical protein